MDKATTRDLPSLREILRRPAFAGAEVVAGRAGLDTPVRWVHVGEIPDIARYLRGQELILSTGVGLRRPQERRRYLERLAECQVAGVCIELGRYLRRVPDDLLQLADRLALPLITFATPVRFVDITRDAHAVILQGEPQVLLSLQELAEDLRGIPPAPGAEAEILGRLGLFLRDAAAFLPKTGQTLRYGPPQRSAALERAAMHLRSDPALPRQLMGQLADGGRTIFRCVGQREECQGLLAAAIAYDNDLAAAGVALDLAASALAQAAAHSPAPRPRAGYDDEQLLASLLLGKRADDRVADGLERYRRDGRLPTRATVILLGRAGPLPAGLMADLAHRLRRLELPALIGPFGGQLAAVLFEQVSPAVLARLTDALPADAAADLPTGVSDHLPLENLPQGLNEAQLALAASSWSRGATGPYYRDLGALRLLAQLRDGFDRDRLIEDELGAVLAYDRRHTAHLTQTLGQLLLCEHKDEAAQHLGIRRQTLYYRIERLASLLGEDFLAPRRRLALLLALLLHELRSDQHAGHSVQPDS